MRLGAVLNPKSEEHDAALSHRRFHHRGFLGYHIAPHKPAALEEMLLGVLRDDVIALGQPGLDAALPLLVRRSTTNVNGGAAGEKRHRLLRNAPSDGMSAVHFEVQERPRDEKLRILMTRGNVADGKSECG